MPEVTQLSTNASAAKQTRNLSLNHVRSPNEVNGDAWVKPAGSVPLCCFAIATQTQVSRLSKKAFTAKVFSLFVCLFYAWQPFLLFNQFFSHLPMLAHHMSARNMYIPCISNKRQSFVIKYASTKISQIGNYTSSSTNLATEQFWKSLFITPFLLNMHFSRFLFH